MKKVLYNKALSLLIWLQVTTCPNLSYAINLLFCYQNNPELAHWEKMKHVLAYIKETKYYSIRYHSGAELKPIGYVDTDFADSSIT